MGMLDGKAVIITGAAAGMGRTHALAVSSAGGSVIVNDIDEAGVRSVVEQIRSSGGRAFAEPGSVSDHAVADRLVTTCVDQFGSVDALVNNAGMYYRASPVEESEARLRRIIDVNVLGSTFCAFAAFRAMVEGGGGVILNVISGAHVGIPGMTVYGTTKGAVASMTYGLALEGQDHGIRVNALSPVAETAMSDGEPRKDGVARPQPETISPAVVFMLSDEAAEITGQVLRFDGQTISFMDLPHFRTKRVHTEDWSAEEIARLYRSELRGERRPVGLGSEISFADGPIVG